MLLLWGRGLGQMQVMQVTYGLATSTEVAYFTYIYATVSGEEDATFIIIHTVSPAGLEGPPTRAQVG